MGQGILEPGRRVVDDDERLSAIRKAKTDTASVERTIDAINGAK